MLLQCVTCNQTFEAKRKDTQYCKTCKKKRRSMQTMLSRKKKHPEVELGVGSGNAKNNQRGPNNHNWKTGIVGYRRLLELTECKYCGSTKNLLIHHIDAHRYNNTIENLIVLCKACHQKHHCKRDSKTGRFVKLQTNTEITD